jgi:hypothetical protein
VTVRHLAPFDEGCLKTKRLKRAANARQLVKKGDYFSSVFFARSSIQFDKSCSKNPQHRFEILIYD